MIREIDSDDCAEGSTTPVIEVEQQKQIEELESIKNRIPLSANENILNITSKEPHSDDYIMLNFTRIVDFKEFLRSKEEYESEKFIIKFPKVDISMLCRVTIIPCKDNFSVKIQFIEPPTVKLSPKEHNKSLVINGTNDFSILNEIPSDSDNVAVMLDDKQENYYDKLFSKELIEIIEKNEICLEIHISIYNKTNKNYSVMKKEKFKLNTSNIYLGQNVCDEASIVYDKLLDPFILRVRLSAPKRDQKCDDFLGIINEGNTCYMGSILQTLFHIPKVRKAVFRIPSTEDTPVFAVQKVFYSLQTENTGIKLLEMFKSLKWDKSTYNTQQDVCEILSYIFDLLAETEKSYFDEDAILKPYCYGDLRTFIKCDTINYESSKPEKFLFLQLDIEHSSNLSESITKILDIENMVGDNQFESASKEKYDALKYLNFEKVPSILFLQLKRFKYDGSKMIKLHNRIEYPETLDFSHFYHVKEDNYIYSLYAVIVHDGSINYGHYFTYLKDHDKDRWIKFNDNRVSIVTMEEVFEKNYGGDQESVIINSLGEIQVLQKEQERSAYILVYIENAKKDDIFKKVQQEDVKYYIINIDI